MLGFALGGDESARTLLVEVAQSSQDWRVQECVAKAMAEFGQAANWDSAALSEQCPNMAQVLQGIATLEAAGGSTMDVAGLNPQVAHLVQSSIGRSV
ncbi:MAG: hypothetical protein LBK54_07900, partial [Propionibacteriaceae bacterium]|nr:hypothetical protein [Propionibacteriaceae bacterium]